MSTRHGIEVRVLGDYGPFSRIGKSIGYQVTIGASSYLVDCGSPVFQKIGGHGLKHIKGLIITHCHDDHKRWFSDFALFNRYAPDIDHKITVMSSEEINQGLIDSSDAALGSSLSSDSKRKIDIAYDEYVNFVPIAPRARYRIVRQELGGGSFGYRIVDASGAPVGPERAKIVLNPKRPVPRMLFRDPHCGEWIEPETFYPFSAEVFYEKTAPFEDPEGFTIEAINAPVWHGIASIGVKFTTSHETLVFSSDTNHNEELWKQLCQEKISRQGLSAPEFLDAAVIHGDINDYVERIWSEARYLDAVSAFEQAIVFHDIALRKSVVHTDYRDLDKTRLQKGRTLLTHSPDKITSAWVLCEADKHYRINGDSFQEIVGSCDQPCIADFFHKEEGRYFVCFRNDSAPDAVYERDGILFLSADPFRGEGRLVCHVDIYEDVGGAYFPVIHDNSAFYRKRPDGRVEKITMGDNDSRGEIVSNQRPRLTKQL